jgi:hypothetical protein
MKVSGVVCFEGLTAADVSVLREFEGKRLPGVGFSFGSYPEKAVVRWDSIACLAVISRMAAIVTSKQDNSQEVVILPLEF